jgi:two-component system, OmpR family, response regulator
MPASRIDCRFDLFAFMWQDLGYRQPGAGSLKHMNLSQNLRSHEPMKILLAEDDNFLANGLSLALQEHGYRVEHARTGPEADAMLRTDTFDLLILDLGLPKMDGLDVLANLRKRQQDLPVLILTARDTVHDRVRGLDAGANDYLTKPFDLSELEARVRALLRKQNWSNRTTITFADLSFDTINRSAAVNGETLDLSAREVAFLELLLQSAGRVVPKSRLIDHLSNWEADVSHNAVEIVAHRLRKKLDKTQANVRTVRGLGYLIETRS